MENHNGGVKTKQQMAGESGVCRKPFNILHSLQQNQKRCYPPYKPTQLHYKTPNYLVSPASNNSIYDIGIHDNPEMESLILSETMEDPGRLKNFELSQFPVSSLVRKRLENTITIR